MPEANQPSSRPTSSGALKGLVVGGLIGGVIVAASGKPLFDVNAVWAYLLFP